MLRLELAVDAIRIEGPLVATGLIIVNPPFTLVERVPLKVPEDQESERYLATKRDRAGHMLD